MNIAREKKEFDLDGLGKPMRGLLTEEEAKQLPQLNLAKKRSLLVSVCVCTRSLLPSFERNCVLTARFLRVRATFLSKIYRKFHRR